MKGEKFSLVEDLQRWHDAVKGKMPASAGARIEVDREDPRDISDNVAPGFESIHSSWGAHGKPARHASAAHERCMAMGFSHRRVRDARDELRDVVQVAATAAGDRRHELQSCAPVRDGGLSE